MSRAVIGRLLREQMGFGGLVLSDDLEMAAVRSEWGVGTGAVRFLAAGGDLALVCRHAETRDEAVGAIGQGLEDGALTPEAVSSARARRAALRRWVERTGTSPDPRAIGCREHQELRAEILGRAGDAGQG
jgi:beta-N-acetylhexosaminidase